MEIQELCCKLVELFPRQHSQTDAFRVLITTVLSQRSRDENTDTAAENLFAVHDGPESLAAADPESLHSLIKPAGIYRQKAVRLVEISKMLVRDFHGKVPQTLEELCSLPGVGRKTANIVLWVSFSIPALAVDTHVHRIANRLGWVNTKTPEQTEIQLVQVLPPSCWGPINGSLVNFGQQVCRPVGPRCESCPIASDCAYAKGRQKK
ncbi:MAG TPA: endonuclease III [Thermotogota bacterium]|nr:endonuclease III [Thermotogota bacterium]